MRGAADGAAGAAGDQAPRPMPLAGVHVVALEQAVAAPLCTRHLADLGADVIKIERPGGGDFARAYDSAVLSQSAYFVWLNRGKRSVTLDVQSDGGRAALDGLLDRADIFVSNLGPGAVGRLGLDEETLARRWPRLISCAISGYGADGPYRDRKGFDLLLQGESGLTATTGTADAPAKVGISIADIAAGMYALSSILAALRDRDASGRGASIDISMLDCLAEWMMVPMYLEMYGGGAPPRSGMRHASIVPYGPFAVADGSVNLAVQTDGQWRRLCASVLDRAALADDPRYATNELRVRNRATLEPLIEGLLAVQEQAEVTARLERADVPFGAVNTVAGLVGHPQLTQRERWFEVDSEGGPVRALIPPFGIRGVPVRAGTIPSAGQHTDEVMDELREDGRG
ncbi:MAG: itaconate CoA-transferase [Chloroflexota bacterium]|jgi:crotonobetainyl-CoA:carnitine CoA-transferase CaiB-like acyl-CoA transferase|nr:itaconate CoA-transferase [Chloroflexota bacterium]